MENRSLVRSDLGAKTSSSRSESRVRVKGGDEADLLHCWVCGGGWAMSDSEYGRSVGKRKEEVNIKF